MGDYIGDYMGVIKGDTRSLDYSSYTGSLPMEHVLEEVNY